MSLSQPFWLLCLVPAYFLWRAFPLSNRLARVLRALLWSLLILALAGPAISWKQRSGTVIVVADRGLSMPDSVHARIRETMSLLERERPGENRLGLVTFGYDAALESPPGGAAFSEFTQAIDRDGSDLSHALDLALQLIPKGGSARVLLLSDGGWTGTDPTTRAAAAATRGIAIDYREISRDGAPDLAIEEIEAPKTVSVHEGFLLHAWIQTPEAQTVTYELTRGQKLIARGQRKLEAGRNRLVFRDLSGEPGTLAYQLTLRGAKPDPIPQNNRAALYVGVDGPKPLLVVSPTRAGSLAELLQRSGLAAVSLEPDQIGWTLAELSRYSGVLLENVPASTIGEGGMTRLAAWVRESGAGLMISGGRQSYGPGGYYGSPLEAILPLTMELRREHRKLSLAMVIALDRSGSMAAPTEDGTPKMALANRAAVEVLELLAPSDSLAVLAVDSQAHLVAPLRPVENKNALRNSILRIRSEGGGIFVYEALSHAARMLSESEAGARHILLFADAADAEQPGRYRELLQVCTQSGITVSVVGLGTAYDADGVLLSRIAELGGGNVYFTERAENLPAIFAQDTFIVARSTFIEEPTAARFTAGMLSLTPLPFENPPPLDGYNLCYAREEANIAMISEDDYRAPLVASWHVGNGRVLCYTGEAAGASAGGFGSWSKSGDFFTSLARWTTGLDHHLPGGGAVTQRVRDGVLRVTLHLDPEREAEAFEAPPRLSLLRGTAGSPPRQEEHAMVWRDADSLVAEIKLRGEETALPTLVFAEDQRFSLAPGRPPYSPEYRPRRDREGLRMLERVARISGGRERVQLDQIWNELPARPTDLALAPFLLLSAALLFLLEILERRTAWLSHRRRRQPVARPAPARAPAPAQPRARPQGPAEVKEAEARKPRPAFQEQPSALQSALSSAKTRAARRTSKD